MDSALYMTMNLPSPAFLRLDHPFLKLAMHPLDSGRHHLVIWKIYQIKAF